MPSHDISHCQGNYCEKKETCHRYLQHKRLMDKDYIGVVSYLLDEECIENEHRSYWEEENANKSS